MRPAKNRSGRNFDMRFRCLSVRRRPSNIIGYQVGPMSCQSKLLSVVTAFVSRWHQRLPALKTGGLYETNTFPRAGVVARLFRGEGFPPRVKKGPASKDAGYSKSGA